MFAYRHYDGTEPLEGESHIAAGTAPRDNCECSETWQEDAESMISYFMNCIQQLEQQIGFLEAERNNARTALSEFEDKHSLERKTHARLLEDYGEILQNYTAMKIRALNAEARIREMEKSRPSYPVPSESPLPKVPKTEYRPVWMLREPFKPPFGDHHTSTNAPQETVLRPGTGAGMKQEQGESNSPQNRDPKTRPRLTIDTNIGRPDPHVTFDEPDSAVARFQRACLESCSDHCEETRHGEGDSWNQGWTEVRADFPQVEAPDTAQWGDHAIIPDLIPSLDGLEVNRNANIRKPPVPGKVLRVRAAIVEKQEELEELSARLRFEKERMDRMLVSSEGLMESDWEDVHDGNLNS